MKALLNSLIHPVSAIRWAVIASLCITSAGAQVFVQEIAPADLTPVQHFGKSLASNATLFAVGSILVDKPPTTTTPLISGAGAVYLFNRATGTQTRKLFSPTPEQSAQFGYSLALEGNILAVGAAFENADSGTDTGAVYLFNATTGALIRKITAATPGGGGSGEGAFFGSSLAIAGDYLVIGAPGRDHNFDAAGAVYIYNLKTGIMSGLITPSSGEGMSWYFGLAVAAQGGFVAVGAPYANSSGGYAYLFDAATGAELHRFVAADSLASDFFGFGLAFARDRLVVGAPTQSSGNGKVYAYDIWATGFPEVWTQPGDIDSNFGRSLAGADDLVAVGAPLYNPTASPFFQIGAVKVFSARNGESVIYALTASDPVDADNLGDAVAVSGSTILATASNRNSRVNSGGAAFKFSALRTPLPFFERAVKNAGAPGALDTSFFTFNQLAISPGSFMTFDANVTGAGAAGGRGSGIWGMDQTFSTRNVRRTGVELQAGQPRKGTDFTNPVRNVDQIAGFTGVTSGLGVNTLNDKVFTVWDNTASNGLITLPVVEGVTTVGPGKVSDFQPPRQSYVTIGGAFPKCFAVPYTLRLQTGIVDSGNDSGVVMVNAAGVAGGSSRVSEGTLSPVPPVPGPVPYGQFLPRVAFPSERGIYAAFLKSPAITANNLGVFSFGSGGEVLIARKGANAPAYNNVPPAGYTAGAGNWGTFSNFLGESHAHYQINPSLSANVIRASVIPPVGTGNTVRNEGLWSNRSGAFLLALLKGGSDPTLPPGVTIKSFLRFGATYENHIFAWVQLQGTGVTTANDGALLLSRNTYISEPGRTEILLREGDPAPGCGRARVGVIQAVDSGINGSYVVLASLIVETGSATATDNQALFMGGVALGAVGPVVYAQPRLMLRKGTQFIRTGSSIVLSISLPGYTTDATGAMDSGLARVVKGDAMTRDPTCSAVVSFADGQTSLMSIFP